MELCRKFIASPIEGIWIEQGSVRPNDPRWNLREVFLKEFDFSIAKRGKIMSCTILSPDPLIRLSSTHRFRAKNGSKSPVITARLDDSKNSPNRQLNLSVLRFTLGISFSPSIVNG